MGTVRIPPRRREPELSQSRAGCSNRQARHLHEGGRSGAEHVRAQVVGSGEHKKAAVGFHRLLSLSCLSFKAVCPGLHRSLVGQECHCVRLLSFFLSEHCKNESSLLLLDLRSIRSGCIGEIGPAASNFMDDFSQRDWTVMGFQFKRGPQRRSKAKIEFFGQSGRSITTHRPSSVISSHHQSLNDH